AVAKNDAPAIKQAMEATTDGEQKAYGAFLLAAIANQEQQYAQEFALLQEGHALYKGHHTFRYSDTHYLKRLPEMARARQLDHTPSNSNNDALASMQPVFIVGTPRCGSTLLESMLKSGAPELIDTEESGVMLHAADLSQCDNSETWLQTYRERIRAAYRDFGVEAPQCRFSDKTLDHFFVLDLILKVFPQAKVIWMRRHPYAVTMSILKNNMIHLPWAHDVNQIFEYIDLQNTLMAHWKDQFGDAILELEYESLASDPETQAKHVFEFCELEWNASALNFHKQTTKASKTASAAQIREGINTRAIRAYEPYIAQLDQAQKASDEQQLS
ncbi:MAG: sulfotransferase, partial [Salinisphaeraceae bacterium]|nr:sulfotransferase [Salinisphaeraceae bacterium]